MRTADTTSARIRAAALAAVAAVLLAACGDSEPARNKAGMIEGTGEVRLLKLRVGDCVANLLKSVKEPDGSANGVPRVKVLPCAQRHDAQVVRIDDLGDGPWPGPTIVNGEAARGTDALQSRLAAALGGGRLSLFTFKPTQPRWDFEDQHRIFYLTVFPAPRRGALRLSETA